jgi:hypothetical protein
MSELETVDLKYEPCQLRGKIKKCVNGYLLPVKGYPGIWKCNECGAEVYTADMPSWDDYKAFMDSQNIPKLMSPGIGAIKHKGGSKSGKRRKKKKSFKPNYRFEIKKKQQ